MTTLRHLGIAEAGCPHTHILILGLGKYCHLHDGETPYGPDRQTFVLANDFGLTQLTSPPVSARAFADWVLSELDNPDAPLGTVEMLLSEQTPKPYVLPDGSAVAVDSATIDTIEAAFNAWYARCDDHPDNIAIFYFCGHGVMIEGDQVLLAEDFGANTLLPFDGAINFSKMFRGMARCKAKLHCYFVDACSNVPVDALRVEDAGARSLIQSDRLRPRTPGLVLKAAIAGQSTYATSGQVSRFTKALIHCLRGLGSANEGGRWVIRTSALFDRLLHVVKWLYETEEVPQDQKEPMQLPGNGPDIPDGVIHVHKQAPLVPITIRLDPSAAMKEANIDLRATADATWRPNPAWQPAQGGDADAWELDPAPAGWYRLSVQFPSGAYRADGQPIPLIVQPPGPWPQPSPIPVQKEGA